MTEQINCLTPGARTSIVVGDKTISCLVQLPNDNRFSLEESTAIREDLQQAIETILHNRIFRKKMT